VIWSLAVERLLKGRSLIIIIILVNIALLSGRHFNTDNLTFRPSHL
jgi:hypothetical protein